MKLEEAKSIFAVAGVPVLAHWELANQNYKAESWFERDYVLANPHWLFKTPIGLIRLGWTTKMFGNQGHCLVEIDWQDTGLRYLIPAPDHVARTEIGIHAWTVREASPYLAALWAHAKTEPQPNAGDAP